MAGMSQTGCCCTVTHGTCVTCEPTQYICCLQLEHLGWNANSCILVSTKADYFPEATEDCPVDFIATEICGYLVSGWNACGVRGLGGEGDGYDLPFVKLSWKPIEGDCDRILMTLAIGAESSATTTLEVNRTWYTRDMTFTDPLDGVSTIYIRTCPADYTPFPPLDPPVVLEAVLQRNTFTIVNPTYEECYESNPECVNYVGPCWPCPYVVWNDDWEDYPIDSATTFPHTWWQSYCQVRGKTQGNCGCGRTGCCVSPRWAINLYSNTVFIVADVYPSNWETWTFSSVEPYTGCGWYEGEIFLYPEGTFAGSDHLRVRVQPVEWGEGCQVGEGPDPAPGYCKRKTLCVRLTVPTEGHTDYLAYGESVLYNLLWQESTQQYELGPAGAASRPYTIEITLVEDAGSLPGGSPAGSRAWILTVTIKDAVTGDVVLEYTQVLVIDCTQAWSREYTMTVPLTPDEDWNLRIGTSCPAAPPPPECDPLCWPECVLCPTPLAMSLVVTQDPSCCLHGSYGLTYNSGSNWFTLTSAPVGGPSGVCGKITAFKMTCSDSTHVTLAITYEDVNGSTINSTTTVAASCSGGGFETASVTVTSGLFAPGLCEGGFGLGAKFRVVGI
ncbi:hypothetical protein UFOVP785_40 [uncultured Caudovirales phage]|uniref:Uncharacterized protein n=1 Tax=uncultured Caudovirales phage TaxID=2100421 RepID=A0A6J5NZC7_9CAUD|nr:hypothetical protein UFOVP785_40 [uncultured Caudovirales phage]